MSGGSALTGAALTAFLAAVFLRALWHKIDAFAETTGFVAGYGLVPPGREALVTRALIGAEIAVVVALVLPALRPAGALGAAVLLAGYGLAMALALRAGRDRIDCGCGGPPQFVSGLTLGRNGVLSVLALALAALPVAPLGGPGAAVVALAAGLTLWVLYGVIEKLTANAGHIRAVRPRQS